MPPANLNKKEKIMLVIPCVDRRINSSLSAFLWIAGRLSQDSKCKYWFEYLPVPEVRPVSYARNCGIYEFLRSDCNRLWFIDNDIIPPPDAFDLLEIDEDVVVGVCPLPGREQITTNVYKYTGEWPKPWSTTVPTDAMQVEEIDAGGTGSMIIKRKVLEDPALRLRSEFFDLEGHPRCLDEEEAPPVFQDLFKPNGQRYAGQDLEFCLRAKKAGYKIVTNYQIFHGHFKRIDMKKVIQYFEVRDEVRRATQELPTNCAV